MIKPVRPQGVIFTYSLKAQFPFIDQLLTYRPKQRMRTRTTGLTVQELARYLGGRVQMLVSGTDTPNRNAKLVAVDIVNEEVKIAFEGGRTERDLAPDAIRPVLRRLTSINDDEAKTCFKEAYECEGDITVSVIRGHDYIELFSDPVTLIITTQGVISSSRDSGHRVSPARINARAVLNYLDAQGFDLDGLIDAGFSVDDDTLEA